LTLFAVRIFLVDNVYTTFTTNQDVSLGRVCFDWRSNFHCKVPWFVKMIL
jgi:hypothetical protein